LQFKVLEQREVKFCSSSRLHYQQWS